MQQPRGLQLPRAGERSSVDRAQDRIHKLGGKILKDMELGSFLRSALGAVWALPSVGAGKRIASMQIIWHEDVHKWHPGQRWIWEPGGFGVFDPGINAFSIATRIFPGSLFVREALLSVPAGAQTPIAADVTFASPEADGPLTASLDWRRTEGEEWTIAVRTTDGLDVRLEQGGLTLIRNGERQAFDESGEYPDIYRRFVDLVDERGSEVDIGPLRLVADCLLVGRRLDVEPA